MTAEGEVVCKNSECRVATSGKCVEGLPLSECPHYGKVASTAEQPSGSLADTIFLRSAGRLGLGPASALRRGGESRVVAIVGPADAGKTSLVASLYDLFQNGPVGRYSFGRSSTLHAFEEACHQARAASRRALPGISRTPVGGVAFYHLQLAASDRLPIHLLLADRSGEDYRTVADTPTASESFVEIHRADTISFLIDGARLLDSTVRHNVRSEAILILQGLLDGGAMRHGQRIALTLTKADEIAAADQPVQDRVASDFTGIVEQVRKLFPSASIEAHRVAASPKKTVPGVERGSGVAHLLAFWMNSYAAPVNLELPAPSPRAFGRLSAEG